MPVVKLRGRGQLTIPYEYRKELGIGKEDVLNVLKIGVAMKKKGLTLDNLLKNLREQRKKYSSFRRIM